MKTRVIACFYTLIFFLLFCSCKEESLDELIIDPYSRYTTVERVTYKDAFCRLSGKPVKPDGAQYGLCWSDSWDFVLGTAIGSAEVSTPFTEYKISNLKEGYTYYVRGYVVYRGEINYWAPTYFQTDSLKNYLPVVTTSIPAPISNIAALCCGSVRLVKDAPILEYGFCWSEGNNLPTLNDSYVHCDKVLVESEGVFCDTISLNPNILYSVRAYATNEHGVQYGNRQEVKTLSKRGVLNVFTTPTGAFIQIDGIPRGVSPQTMELPVGGHTVMLSQTGYVSTTCTVTIRDGQTEELNVTLSLSSSCGGIIFDKQGNTYTTKLMNDNRCWMTQNLRRTDVACTYPNGSASNTITHGCHYDWNTAMQGSTTEGAQGICPDGWHLPTDGEWKTLEMAYGMSQTEADAAGNRGSDQGTQFKPGGSSGFNMTLSGDSGASSFGTYGSCWSSLGSGTTAWRRYVNSSNTMVNRSSVSKARCYSVRCVRD